MVSKKFRLGISVMVLVFGMTVIGCETLDDLLFGSGSSSSGSYSSSSSGGTTSDGDYTYTFVNNSSKTVNFTFAQFIDGSLAPGQSDSTRWNSAVATVYYTPSDTVDMSYSDGGFTIIFSDK